MNSSHIKFNLPLPLLSLPVRLISRRHITVTCLAISAIQNPSNGLITVDVPSDISHPESIQRQPVSITSTRLPSKQNKTLFPNLSFAPKQPEATKFSAKKNLAAKPAGGNQVYRQKTTAPSRQNTLEAVSDVRSCRRLGKTSLHTFDGKSIA
jgi:hypothetical protein